MSDKTRIKIAAALTALFMVAIAAVGIATHSDSPAVSSAASSSAAPQEGEETSPAAASPEAGYLDTAQQLVEDFRQLIDGEEGDDD